MAPLFPGLETLRLDFVFQVGNKENINDQYVGTWFPLFQGHPLILGAMPLESGAGFA